MGCWCLVLPPAVVLRRGGAAAAEKANASGRRTFTHVHAKRKHSYVGQTRVSPRLPTPTGCWLLPVITTLSNTAAEIAMHKEKMAD